MEQNTASQVSGQITATMEPEAQLFTRIMTLSRTMLGDRENS